LDNIIKKYGSFIQKASKIDEGDKTLFSMGPLSLNLVLGNYLGITSGKLIQIVGRESSGKSTLALDIIRQYINTSNNMAMFIDFERSFDKDYASSMGINLENLYIVKPEYAEQGFDIAVDSIRDGIKLVVIDSMAVIETANDLGKNFGDSARVAASAGLITRFCNRILPIMSDNDSIVVAINQLRSNMNQMSPEQYVPFGGKSLQYATSLRLDITKIKTENTRQTSMIVVKKSKLSAPMGRVDVVIDYGEGINHGIDVLNLAIDLDIVQKSGSWIRYNDCKVQGFDKASKEMDIELIKQEIIKRSVT